MRVSDKMAFDQVNRNISKNRSEMADFQNQAATQKRVTKPSDDPVAAARVLSSRIEVKGADQYLKNIDYARSFLEFTDQSLDELTSHLVRAKELLLSQASDASANRESRNVVAEELGQIYRQTVQIGNRKLGERFIFGGFKTTQKPFKFNGAYGGDQGEMMVNIDKSSFVPMNIPGNAVFRGEGVSRDSVTYKSTEQANTAEELRNQLSAVRKKTNSKGQGLQEEEAVQGSPPVALRGPASLDSNSSTVPENTRSAFNEEYGTNLFSVLRRIEVALKTDDKAGIQDALEPLDAAIAQVVRTRSQIGSRVMVLDSSRDTLLKSRVDSKSLISQLEDVDSFQVISDINKTESTLEATLATSGKMIQKSLMDFVR